MRKLIFLLIITTIFACQEESKSTDLINLKLTEVDGYGPFEKRFGFLDWTPLSEKGIWSNTEIKTTGVPESWITSNVVQVWFDSHQFAYQNYKLGNFSEEFFNELKESWKIDLSKRKFSEKPINCFVHVAIGKNQNEELEYIVDTNNDKDFSDDTIKKPTLRAKDLDYENLIKKSESVIAEISTNDGILSKEIKILVLSTSDGELIYNFPKIAKTTYLENDILVSNGFSYLTYDDKSLITLDVKNTEIVGLNEFIKIEKSLYKNLGVDINTNELQLLKMPKDTILYSTRVGFNVKPFSAKKLESKDSIYLKDFNNKLLYLEFWGTWCAPCITAIPNLKKAYNGTDRKDVEFLGVAVFDTKEKLKSVIEKYDINWPQVLDDDSNKFKESYNVTGYPTSFLIDEEGKIVAKNLRGERLLDTLNYYLNKRK
ncbi:TlpA family protein disulfide reductase [Winogradskyella psychrotolerans]|uniref:TlpA family protein disulfide reductase n=1 Tax=Winogradskyella psychrotolerans TaxID=1344585 RepID=UPI001C06D2D5|nr:TlpA disulfide reductase family protein [Winogradskyella psychrotolerans]MBU2927107.1 TlpA family protein disulfide reductase [Winogradskyella psychrotolerans]